MDQYYQAIGRLVYQNDGWIILYAPNSIVRYYSWWVQRLTWKKGSTPLHGAHCTVVAGKYEDVRKHPNWKKWDGAKVPFEYSSTIYDDDQHYYWLRVKCPFLSKLRQELGLKPYPKWLFHLTTTYID